MSDNKYTGSKKWQELNEQIMACDDTKQLEAMLRAENKRKPPRASFVARIHARLTRVRAAHERKALMSKLT